MLVEKATQSLKTGHCKGSLGPVLSDELAIRLQHAQCMQPRKGFPSYTSGRVASSASTLSNRPSNKAKKHCGGAGVDPFQFETSRLSKGAMGVRADQFITENMPLS